MSPPNATTAVNERRPHLLLRIAAVMVATFLIWQLMGWVSDRLPESPQGGLRHWVNALTVFVLAVPMVWLARRYLDRRPWDGLLLTGPRRGWAPFLVGAVSCLVPGLVGLAAAVLLGWVEITANRPLAETVAAVAVLAVLVLLFEAVPEELIFRGYLFRNLNAVMSGWLAVLAQAALFTTFGLALWIPDAGWGVLPERLPLFLGMGVVLGCVRLVTGNVWACVGFHAAFQTVSQALLNGDLFAVGDQWGLLIPLVLPFVFGALVAALLTRDEGTWRGRVPDPA